MIIRYGEGGAKWRSSTGFGLQQWADFCCLSVRVSFSERVGGISKDGKQRPGGMSEGGWGRTRARERERGGETVDKVFSTGFALPAEAGSGAGSQMRTAMAPAPYPPLPIGF